MVHDSFPLLLVVVIEIRSLDLERIALGRGLAHRWMRKVMKLTFHVLNVVNTIAYVVFGNYFPNLVDILL